MEIRPLREAEVIDLEELLAAEAREWKRQLDWDLRPTVALVKKHLHSRSLSGNVLRDAEGRIFGYEYHVSDPPIGFVGDVFVYRANAPDLAYSALLSKALISLQSNRKLKRIECQFFPLNFDLKPLFEAHGFTAYTRYFLSRETGTDKVWSTPACCPDGIQLLSWKNAFLNAASEVIYDSYHDSADQEICHDYQSLDGCFRFLRNIVASPGCGTFSPETSLVATDALDRVVAVLITSKISDRTGMIPQISVRRDRQGTGIGTALLAHYLEKAQAKGLQAVSLSVSQHNREAHRLYERLGFRIRKTFSAFVREVDDSSRP
jgi:ribosomal protein S18 acetylase RimI-like enzyme